MTITSKSRARRLVQETANRFAPTAQEEAEKINRQTGAGYVTDQAFWERQGISTGEELALSVLGQTYSDYFKEIHGFRPRHAPYKSVEEYNAAIRDLDDYYDSMIAQEKLDAQRQADIEKERKELEELMPGEFDFEHTPQRSGMGRRMENRIRLSGQDLRDIIREAIDGHPYDGRIEDWAAIASNKWGHGSVVDQKGWEDACKMGGLFTIGKAPSMFQKKRGKISERRLRMLIRKALLSEEK